MPLYCYGNWCSETTRKIVDVRGRNKQRAKKGCFQRLHPLHPVLPSSLGCRHSSPTEWLPIAMAIILHQLNAFPSQWLPIARAQTPFVIGWRLRRLKDAESHLESLVPPLSSLPHWSTVNQVVLWPPQFWPLLLFCNFGCITETGLFPQRGASHTYF